MQVTLRAGRASDVQDGGRIVYQAFANIAGRHNFPPDFPSVEVARGLVTELIARADIHAVIAEREGRVVGSNFLWEGDPIAGVGPITVDPAVQDGSIGRQLMQAVLDRAAGQSFVGVRLVQAAYHSRSLSLYTKLGFDAREPLSVMQGLPPRVRVPDCEARIATIGDLDRCAALGRSILGHERVNELRGAIAHGRGTVVERAGRITGYTTGIGFFGHAVAETNADLIALIAAAPEIAGPGFLLPTRNAEVMRWSLAHGLRVVQPMTLMSVGAYTEPTGAWLPSVVY